MSVVVKTRDQANNFHWSNREHSFLSSEGELLKKIDKQTNQPLSVIW